MDKTFNPEKYGMLPASNVMATANYSTNLKTSKFVRDVEGLDLSKRKRAPIKMG